MKRRAFPIHHFALATIALLTTAAPVVAAGPKVVNIINFIRGTEPRANVETTRRWPRGWGFPLIP